MGYIHYRSAYDGLEPNKLVPSADSQEFIKGSRCTPWFLQPPRNSPQFFSSTPGPEPLSIVLFLTTLPFIMFSKAVLTFLAIGALFVNAAVIPIARAPAPEPEGDFPDRSPPSPITI